MKKFILLFLSLILIFPNIAGAEAAMGKLSVYTDLDGCEIYVDGNKVADKNLVNYPLTAEEHYVKVMYQGKKAYAEVVQIEPGKTKTIVSDNFVDFKTNAPSRGAIDKEAARLRESRGNMAFGIYGGTPASGLSFKWWMFEKVGFQISGFTKQNSPDESDDNIGVRVLFNFAEKVYAEDTITAYGALGVGRAAYINKTAAEQTVFSDNFEGALGLEMRLGRAGSQVLTSSGQSSDVINTFAQLLALGILNTCYLSIELGAESKNIERTDPDIPEQKVHEHLTNMKISGGLHYYF